MRFYPLVTKKPGSKRRIGWHMLLCLVMFAVLSTVVTTAHAEPAKLSLQESRVLYQAQQKFKQNDFRQCCQVLEDYLQSHPENRHGRFSLLLGNSYFKLNDFKQAQAAYRQGLGLRPSDPMLNLNLALALENNRQWQLAGEQYIRAYGVQKEPDPQVLYQGAMLLARTKRYRRAAEVLAQLTKEHSPARNEWLELLLYVDFEMQNYPAAIRVTEQLLSRDPEKSVYWQQLAQLRQHRKQYLDAAAAYEVAYQSRAPSRQELEQLAELYLYQNLPLRAAQTLERIGSDLRARADMERVARLYWRGGLLKKADLYLTRIIEAWPDAQAYQLRAELLYEQSAYKQTLQLLEKACNKFPEYAELHLQRGFAAWQLADWDQAARSFASARRFKRTRASADAALQIIEVLRSKSSEPLQPAFPSPLLAAEIH